jgi:hypothetical protein
VNPVADHLCIACFSSRMWKFKNGSNDKLWKNKELSLFELFKTRLKSFKIVDCLYPLFLYMKEPRMGQARSYGKI